MRNSIPNGTSLTRGNTNRSPDADRAGAATTAGDDLTDTDWAGAATTAGDDLTDTDRAGAATTAGDDPGSSRHSQSADFFQTRQTHAI